MTGAITSAETVPSSRPTRYTDSVRIWLILMHDGLRSYVGPSSKARGKPARWG